jgi:hypothetical protein
MITSIHKEATTLAINTNNVTSMLFLVLILKLKTMGWSIHIMVEIGIVEIIGMAGAVGIVASMFIVLYFSRKQAQGFKLDIETKVINDLDEKVRKMAEIIIEKPSLQKVMYKLEKPSEELAFAFYILFICSHAYEMRKRNVLNDDQWTRWLQWMRNSFKYGTIVEDWNLVQSENWFEPSFQLFVNKEVIPWAQNNKS